MTNRNATPQRSIVGGAERAFARTVILLSIIPGCAPKAEELWVQQPQVHWDDLAAAPVSAVDGRYVILEPGPSQGRFPCSVAVSRVSVQDEGDGSRTRQVPVTPQNEFLIWNSAFDELWAVGEVFPVAQRALGGGQAEPRLIVSASRAFGATLSLIYGFNEVSPTRCELLGVLHESETARPIAIIHAAAESVPRPEDEKPAPNNVDAWEHEARALARSRFRELMIQCMLELIARDTPVRENVPEGWTPVYPTRPMEWPPRDWHPPQG